MASDENRHNKHVTDDADVIKHEELDITQLINWT